MSNAPFVVIRWGPWCVDDSPAKPGSLQLGFGAEPDLQSSELPLGEGILTQYLGSDRETWSCYDASVLMARGSRIVPMLVDQGSEDEFLEEQLKPEALEYAAQARGYPLQLNYRQGYDHSYYFVASFIEDHLRFHARYLLDVMS